MSNFDLSSENMSIYFISHFVVLQKGHNVLVDRVATMLNDFLILLVCKKKREQLRAMNLDEVELRVEELVSSICHIYLNLSSEARFCEAVASDDRSYSADLFAQAVQVLEQTHQPIEFVDQFKQFATRIEQQAKRKQFTLGLFS